MSILDSALSYFRRLTVVDGTARVASSGSEAGESVGEGDVLSLAAAGACVKLVAGAIGSLPLMVYSTDAKGDRLVAKNHPLYRLLHDSPNDEQTALDFWEGTAASIELKGNSVAKKVRGSLGRTVALEPMPWDYLNVRRPDRDGPLQYEYRGEKMAPADVLHIRGFGGSPAGGLSTIAMGANTFGLAKAIDRATGATFRNGVRASGAFVSGRPLNPEQMAQAEELIATKYQGAMRAGRPLLLNNDLKWEQLTINPDDAQMLESRAFSVEEICRMFGVPPHMIGHTEKTSSWGTGIEQMTLGFVKYTLRPRLKRIEQALEKQLLTAEDRGRGVSIEFNLEGLLRGDSAARSAFYGAGLDKGWLTINEVRALENRPPVAGGDVPRMQIQNVPITEAGKVSPVAPATV